MGNKKLNQIVSELFIRGIKRNIFTVLITQSYFAVPKDIRLNSTHFLLSNFQTNQSFNESQLINDQILILNTL